MTAEFTSLLRGVFWVLVFARLLPTQADSDLWGNLKFGLDLLETWSFSTVDPLSFTQDIPWVNHSWLPQVMLATAYQAVGVAGIVALKVLLLATILWLVAGAFKESAPLIAEGAVAVVLITALPVFATARAQLWTFLGVVLLCRLILSANSPRNPVDAAPVCRLGELPRRLGDRSGHLAVVGDWRVRSWRSRRPLPRHRDRQRGPARHAGQSVRMAHVAVRLRRSPPVARYCGVGTAFCCASRQPRRGRRVRGCRPDSVETPPIRETRFSGRTRLRRIPRDEV